MSITSTVLRQFRRCLGIFCLLSVAGAPLPGVAYEADLHQQLTFIAAKHFNSCVDELDLPLPTLTPLQVRYIARTNVQQAQANVLTRMFRWDYYDRAAQSSRRLMWLVDTRFHDHFREAEQRLWSPRNNVAFYRDLGRVANYVQAVTSPAHAVPVYTGRWWRLSMADRFDEFAMDVDAVTELVRPACRRIAEMDTLDGDFEAVLRDVADATLTRVRSEIEGMPTTWQVFWRLAKKQSNFGEYGRAGNNFGQSVAFRCGDRERCVLLDNDPLYVDFATERQAAAVLGTMRIMFLAARLGTAEPGS